MFARPVPVRAGRGGRARRLRLRRPPAADGRRSVPTRSRGRADALRACSWLRRFWRCAAPAQAGPQPPRVASLNLTADEVLVEILPAGASRRRSPRFADEPGTSNVVGPRAAAAAPASPRRTWSGCVALRPDLVVVSEYTDADFLQLLERSRPPHPPHGGPEHARRRPRRRILDLGARGGRAGGGAHGWSRGYDAMLRRPRAAARGRAAAARALLGERHDRGRGHRDRRPDRGGGRRQRGARAGPHGHRARWAPSARSWPTRTSCSSATWPAARGGAAAAPAAVEAARGAGGPHRGDADGAAGGAQPLRRRRVLVPGASAFIPDRVPRRRP